VSSHRSNVTFTSIFHYRRRVFPVVIRSIRMLPGPLGGCEPNGRSDASVLKPVVAPQLRSNTMTSICRGRPELFEGLVPQGPRCQTTRSWRRTMEIMTDDDHRPRALVAPSSHGRLWSTLKKRFPRPQPKGDGGSRCADAPRCCAITRGAGERLGARRSNHLPALIKPVAAAHRRGAITSSP